MILQAHVCRLYMNYERCNRLFTIFYLISYYARDVSFLMKSVNYALSTFRYQSFFLTFAGRFWEVATLQTNGQADSRRHRCPILRESLQVRALIGTIVHHSHSRHTHAHHQYAVSECLLVWRMWSQSNTLFSKLSLRILYGSYQIAILSLAIIMSAVLRNKAWCIYGFIQVT